MMNQQQPRIGLALLTFVPVETAQFVELARYAEALDYGCVYTTESLTDTFAIDMAIAAGTTRIDIGSFVALTYLRHPSITAQAAATIQDVSGGRFVLGLGLGHKVRMEALGIDVGDPVTDLSAYVADVRAVLSGQGRARYPDLPPQMYQDEQLDFRVADEPVPIFTAAVGPRMAQLGGNIADGLMLYMQPRHGIAEIRDAALQGAGLVDRSNKKPELHLAIHAFVADDEELAVDRARASLTYWVGLPAYNRRIAAMGFEDEAEVLREAFKAGDMGRVRDSISDELVRQFTLVGPADSCRRQVEQFYAEGVDVVAVMPDPVDREESYPDAVRRTLEALQS